MAGVLKRRKPYGMEIVRGFLWPRRLGLRTRKGVSFRALLRQAEWSEWYCERTGDKHGL